MIYSLISWRTIQITLSTRTNLIKVQVWNISSQSLLVGILLLWKIVSWKVLNTCSYTRSWTLPWNFWWRQNFRGCTSLFCRSHRWLDSISNWGLNVLTTVTSSWDLNWLGVWWLFRFLTCNWLTSFRVFQRLFIGISRVAHQKGNCFRKIESTCSRSSVLYLYIFVFNTVTSSAIIINKVVLRFILRVFTRFLFGSQI